jgi:hypothetical protein
MFLGNRSRRTDAAMRGSTLAVTLALVATLLAAVAARPALDELARWG